jgi:hypothetical protein
MLALLLEDTHTHTHKKRENGRKERALRKEKEASDFFSETFSLRLFMSSSLSLCPFVLLGVLFTSFLLLFPH